MSTVFWSWQSDLDARVTRDLIRTALEGAVEDLHAELDERHEVDSDTKGVAGSPDIIATILAKIDAAAVFVGDVTPIAASGSGKAVANPNVLIELGYAKKSLGLGRVITVWNTAFPGAEIERLPFDMRGRRAPVSYHLPADAPRETLRRERDGLRKTLAEALRLSIAGAPSSPRQPAPEWQPPSLNNAALWFEQWDVLAINEDGDAGGKAIGAGPFAYVRILPRSWKAPADFGQGGRHPSILGDTRGFSRGMTRGGMITYTGSLRAAGNPPLTNFVMQFRSTGEIWGVTPGITDQERGGTFFADSLVGEAYSFLESNIAYLQSQGAGGPYDIRMGFADMSSMKWRAASGWGGRPIALEYDAEAAMTLSSNDEAEILGQLDAGWAVIAQAFGLPAPPRTVLAEQIRSGLSRR
jgi:hypothetical protein